jgi:hypothetical protein
MDINNIYFYLLLGVFLYFLFTYILENYLVEQENFDPSLVPVSSIVTLAKVAQKLVNGNGTLTNPGNLQIGKDMQATGNLTVTGKTAIGSTTMGDKTLNVTGTIGVSGDTTVGGKLDVTGNTAMNPKEYPKDYPKYTDPLLVKFKGSGAEQSLISFISTPTLNIGKGWNNGDIIQSSAEAGLSLTSDKGVGVLGKFGVTGDTGIGGNATVDGKLILTNNGGSGYITSGEGKTGTPGRLHISNGEDLYLLPKGTTHVSSAWGGTGNLNVSGRLTIPHSVWHQSSDGKNRLHYGQNSHTHFGTNDGYIWRSSADRDLMNLNSAGDLTVKGNINSSTAEGIKWSDSHNCASNLKMPTVPGIYIFTLLNYSSDWLGVWYFILYINNNNKMVYRDYQSATDRNRSCIFQNNTKLGNTSHNVVITDNPPPDNLYFGVDGWYQGPPANTSSKVTATWSKLVNY